jgi:hypothetical protein
MTWSPRYGEGVSAKDHNIPLGGNANPDKPRPSPSSAGYSAEKDALLKRLRRIEGQVRGVQGMVADDRHGIDVLTQISAVQAAPTWLRKRRGD